MLENRRTLPLLGAHQGRSARTCALKCGSACFHEVPNASTNDYIGDVITASLQRRTLLKGAFGAMVLAGVPGVLRPQLAHAAEGVATDSGTGLTFTPIAATDAAFDDVVVPTGYEQDLLIRWGDPVVAGARAFDYDNQNAGAQSTQFGYNCDYVGFLPTGPAADPSSRGLLTVNHEYTEPDRMFPGYDARATRNAQGRVTRFNPTRAEVDTELEAHGISVLEIARSTAKGSFAVVSASAKNRRITGTTPHTLTGPAAGSDLLKTSQDPTGRTVLGTLNNCAGGMTPWGTVLSGEENFNQYFGKADAVADPTTRARHARYGLPRGASERRWEDFHPRFDLSKEPNEAYRFGYVVEVDPDDPTSTPRKHTALGRFKHEAATVSIASDGRAVAYSGDDERFDYVYKFISRKTFIEGDKAHNMTLLEEGDLYVAKFTGDSPQGQVERYNASATLGQRPSDGSFDGSGTWIPLVLDGQSKVPGMSVAEVLVLTRLAADKVGATKMDRPEDVERNPVNGRVYLAMTNNTDRRNSSTNPRTDKNNRGIARVDEANPRRVDEKGAPTGNKYGHVIELVERGGKQTATSFTWRIFLVCGNPEDPTTYFAGFPKDQVSPVSCPDNVAFDRNGNLWLATDGAPGTIGKSDAFHAVPVSGPERGRARQFLSVPAGAEACGPEITPDMRTLFCAVQHPGEGRTSTWPDRTPGIPARPSVITVFHSTTTGLIGQ